MTIAVLAAGCATAEVYGIVGDEGEIFTGSATGYMNRTGTIELDNGKGTKCIGEFAYTGARSGHGLLTCNDGQRATIQFNGLSPMSGYGFGTSTSGKTVKFTFGLGREESTKYIGSQSASAAPGGNAARPPSGATTGTGFYVSRQGHVLTNAHVVRNCKSITTTRQGEPPVPASLVNADASNDLAVLKSNQPSATVAAFRSGRPVRQGESVVAYGFPYSDVLSSGGSITTGSISALTGLRDDTRYLQISAPVQPGNSGGPLLDTGANVVGVVSAALRPRGSTIPQNVNFAIKADVVRTFLEVQGVSIETSASGREFSMPDIGERARAFSVLVRCTL